ncbi:MAG: HEAT repeat domain-containing protein [Candidatus Rifleibacteriota bacterium]
MANLERLNQELSAPIESVRIFALEDVLKTGGDDRILALLKQFQKNETDEECLLLFSYAIDKLESSLAPQKPAVEASLNSNDFLKNFSRLDNTQKLNQLSRLLRSDCKKLAVNCLEFLKHEKHPAVLRKLMLTFCPLSEQLDLNYLKSFLSHPAIGVRIAALQLLIQKAPETILKALPKLIRNPDANLRTLAIRGLARLDQTIALRYFDHFLFNGSEFEKKAILANSIFFEFSLIKESLLRFLILENKSDLLNPTSLLLINNPEMEMIKKLWLYLEKCGKGKKEFVTAVINECLNQLQASTGNSQGCRKEFEQWKENIIHTRQAMADAGELIASDFSDEELKARLRNSLANAAYRQAFERFVILNKNEKAKTALATLLESPIPQKKPSEPEKIEAIQSEAKEFPANFSLLSAEDKALVILNLSPKILEKSEDKLKLIFSESFEEKPVVLAILKVVKRHNLNNLIDLGKRALKHAEPAIVGAAIEFLATIDTDWFFSIVGKFIKHENKLIKRSTIKALKDISLDRAIAAINLMLKGRNHQQTLDALVCMIYFDFSFVRNLVRNIARETADPEIFDSAMILYQNNPEIENLYDLYFLEKKGKTDSSRKKAGEIKKNNIDFLLQINSLDQKKVTELEKEFAAKLAEEEAMAAKARESYNLDNTIDLPPHKEFWFFILDSLSDLRHQSFDQIIQHLISKARKPRYVVTLVVALALIWFLAAGPDSAPQKSTKASAIVSETTIICGRVKEISPRRLTVVVAPSTVYLLKPMRGKFSDNIKQDEKVILKIRPIRRSSNNEILAVCLD